MGENDGERDTKYRYYDANYTYLREETNDSEKIFFPESILVFDISPVLRHGLHESIRFLSGLYLMSSCDVLAILYLTG